MKTPHFWCDIEWEAELREKNIRHIVYSTGQVVEGIKRFQQGKCKKCGKIYRREVEEMR